MCGRFTLRTPKERIKREFQLPEEPSVEARYNIAPTQNIIAVRQSADGREAVELKWGLIPSWAKDASMGARLINARSETVTEKPSFREAFKRRRCIIPADGIYEWQRTGGRKQPFFIHVRDGRVFGFAGLWDKWRDEEGEIIESCTILTTEANEVFRPVHDRMPVILPPETYDEWLGDDARGVEALKELLRPYPSSEMVAYPVSPQVNSPQSQGSDLIKRQRTNSA
jgi:putative SOS response-associated peptidase YedK